MGTHPPPALMIQLKGSACYPGRTEHSQFPLKSAEAGRRLSVITTKRTFSTNLDLHNINFKISLNDLQEKLKVFIASQDAELHLSSSIPVTIPLTDSH